MRGARPPVGLLRSMPAALGRSKVLRVAEAFASDGSLRDVPDAIERAIGGVEPLEHVFAQAEDIMDRLHVERADFERPAAFLLDPTFHIDPEAREPRWRNVYQEMRAPMCRAFERPDHRAGVWLPASAFSGGLCPPAITRPDAIERRNDGILFLHSLLREIDRHELVEGRAETFGEKDGGAAVTCLPAADVIRLPASHRHYILSENREYILLMDARSRIVPSALLWPDRTYHEQKQAAGPAPIGAEWRHRMSKIKVGLRVFRWQFKIGRTIGLKSCLFRIFHDIGIVRIDG